MRVDKGEITCLHKPEQVEQFQFSAAEKVVGIELRFLAKMVLEMKIIVAMVQIGDYQNREIGHLTGLTNTTRREG